MSGFVRDRRRAAGEDRCRPRVTLSCAGGDRRQLVADAVGGEMRGAGDGGGEAAGIVARRDRPGVARRIEIGDDAHGLQGQAEPSATTCASTVRWPWPCGTEATLTVTEPSGSMATVAVAWAPFFGPAFARSSGGQDRRDVAHVRDARLDDRRKADAVEPPFGARLHRVAAAELGEAAFGQARSRAVR